MRKTAANVRVAFAVAAFAVALGGCTKPKEGPPRRAKPTFARKVRAGVSNEVFKVGLGQAPVRGGKRPKVTIVEYSDFECPYCARAQETLKRIQDSYGDDVQFAFKHFPLGIHANAVPAAALAEAARAQGKFWPMHDKLFESHRALDRPSLERYARELGLDEAKVEAALDAAMTMPALLADFKEGERLGVTGTPHFFINGRPVRGAQAFENFKYVIDEEIQVADAQLAAGVPRDQLYATFIAEGLEKAPPPPRAPPSAPRVPRAGEPVPGVAYRAELGRAPLKGAKDALVTIVEYSDFECPFCGRVEPTLDRVMKEYAGKVRIAWKDYPLSFHPNAVPAALAARAAGEQGKFWQMHGRLFANQRALDGASLEKYAREIGLDLGRWKAAVADEKRKQEVFADMQQGGRLGANGTPAFFINGVFLSGAQPFEGFATVIDAELKKAAALVARGTPKAEVYAAIMKTAKGEVAGAAPTLRPLVPGAAAGGVFAVDPGAAPSRGPKNAPVTVVMFSDFECHHCSRADATVARLEQDYAGKIRVVWKNHPQPFHGAAKAAAAAALAAGEEGKFWQMHAKLFANQRALDRISLERYARELGLDAARFKAALDSNRYAAQIEADAQQVQALGVTGAPASFVNGRLVSGVHSYDALKKLVDEELAKPKREGAAGRRRG